MQPVFDELYRRSLDGDNFTDLMDIIPSRDNILSGISEHQSKRRKLHSRNRQKKTSVSIGCFTARNSSWRKEVYCHRKSARIPTKTGQA